MNFLPRFFLIGSLLLGAAAHAEVPADTLPLMAELENVGSSNAKSVMAATLKMVDKYRLQGRHADVLPLTRKYYQASLAVYGPHHASTVQARKELAMVLRGAGLEQETVALTRAYVVLARDYYSENSPGIASALYLHGRALRDMGELDEAWKVLSEALEIYKGTSGYKSFDALRVRYELARIRDLGGLNAEALNMARNNWQDSIGANGETHMETLTNLEHYATLLRKVGNAGEAVRHLELLWKYRRDTRGETHPDTLNILNFLANAQWDLGQFAESQKLLADTLAVQEKTYGAKHIKTIGMQSSFANRQVQTGQAAMALPVLAQIWDVNRERFGATHQDALQAQGNYAQALKQLGRLEESLMVLRENQAISRQVLGNAHPVTITATFNLALLLNDAGKTPEAGNLLKEGLAAARETHGDRHPTTMSFLYHLARQQAKEGQRQAAQENWNSYIAGVEYLRQYPGLASDQRQSFFARHASAYREYARFLLDGGELESAFLQVERSKARTLLEETASRQAVQVLPEAERAQLARLDAGIARLNEQAAKSETAEQRIALRQQLNPLLDEYSRLQIEFQKIHPRYARLREVQLLGLSAGQKNVPDDAAFISYFRTDKGWQAFLLDKQNVRAVKLDLPLELDESMLAYRAVLELPNGLAGLQKKGQTVWKLAAGGFRLLATDALPPAGAQRVDSLAQMQSWLGDRLLGPLRNGMTGKKRWLISPDGALALLPFDTLLLDGEAVLKTHDISLVQSLSVYALLQERQQAYRHLAQRRPLFAMGAANYQAPEAANQTDASMPSTALNDMVRAGLRSGVRDTTTRGYVAMQRSRWFDLPGAQKELDAARTIFGMADADMYARERATEAQLQRLDKEGALANYRYLLFSTHGFLSTDVPLLSAIVLGQDKVTDAADGYVTAAEWPAYNLQSDLVVLSACETGVGTVVQGEGVMGLPYALYVAGNLNTVLTLWQVDDDATAEFMKRFLSRLHAGEDPGRALNAVKREFLLDSKPGMRTPAWWAGFVFYGV